MTDLDQKLALILEDAIEHSNDSQPMPLPTGGLTTIELIKHAFEDAGYLSGQEWYDCFIKGLSELHENKTADDAYYLATHAARRAAGLSNE